MTLIRAWRSRDKLAAAGDSARTWLYTVARHILVDDYRARSARPTLLTGDLQATAQANDIDRVVLSLAIDQALAMLSEAHRQAVVCTLLQQHSIAEAARILGVTEGTVKSRVHYGIRALRKALEGNRTGTTRHPPRVPRPGGLKRSEAGIPEREWMATRTRQSNVPDLVAGA
jgi:RNA polymerase sigma-70 factor (ECF subfamily)